MYDDLIDESFLLLLPTVTEEILSVDEGIHLHTADALATLYGNWRISPESALQLLLSTSPIPQVVSVAGIELSLSDIVQALMSYQAFAQYPTVTDEGGAPITDLDGAAITEETPITQQVELLRDRGINPALALMYILSTSPDPGVFGGLVLAMANAVQELWDGMTPYYDPITDEDGEWLTDETGDAVRSLLQKTILYLSVDSGLAIYNAIHQVLSDSPAPTRISNLLAGNATQLLVSDQVQYAAAALLSVANALQQQVATEPNLTFELSLSPDLSINQQIVDAITASAAHAVIAGASVNEILDDTAYLARSLVSSVDSSLQTLTSDALAIRFVANLLADTSLHTITDTQAILHAVYALLLNTAVQLQPSEAAIVDYDEFVLALQDAIQTLPDISPTLAAIFTLLINDCTDLVITEDAYVARAITTQLGNILHALSSDNVGFGEEVALALNDALNEIVSTLPGVTVEGLVYLIREVLARGYYFFKAKDKLRR